MIISSTIIHSVEEVKENKREEGKEVEENKGMREKQSGKDREKLNKKKGSWKESQLYY